MDLKTLEAQARAFLAGNAGKLSHEFILGVEMAIKRLQERTKKGESLPDAIAGMYKFVDDHVAHVQKERLGGMDDRLSGIRAVLDAFRDTAA